MADSDALYRQEFLRRANNLKSVGELENATTLHAVNPLCGDKQDIDVKIEDGVVADARFRPTGCLVSQVSTDLLIEAIKGMKTTKVSSMGIDDIVALLHTPLTPSRQKCALLGLAAIQDHLKTRND